MIDTQKIQDEVVSSVAETLKRNWRGIHASSEPGRLPQKFPFVAVQEVDCFTAKEQIDSSPEEKYVSLTYKVDVFSDSSARKAPHCRAIMNMVRFIMFSMGFRCESQTSPTELESSGIYWCSARFTGKTDGNLVYRR